MAFSAFQSSSYQQSAYQIIVGAPKPYTGGGSPDNYYWDRVKQALNQDNDIRKLNEIEKQKRLAEEELALKEVEIENLELKRLQALADQKLQSELLFLFEQAQQLEKERQYLEGLVRWMRLQEDDLLVILLSLPFAG